MVLRKIQEEIKRQANRGKSMKEKKQDYAKHKKFSIQEITSKKTSGLICNITNLRP